MWFLKSVKNDDIIYLLVGEEYSVGRKEASIMITDDQSISRKHAVLILSHSEINLNNSEKLAILTIKDASSKYGTYLNRGKRIDSEGAILKIGDKVTFGQCESSYQVCYEPIIISTSCVEIQQKKSLKAWIRKLGGHMVSEWQKNCTHLVMKEIKVTIKAVCAMVSLKPLVTIEYFKDLIRCIVEKNIHPNPESYVPNSAEPLLTKENVSFRCKPERTTLFKNKTFICTSQKQYKKLHLGITLASGIVKLLNDDEEIKASVFLHPDTVIMKYQSDSSSVPSQIPIHFETIENELRRNQKRVIPESDIGLAVVFCSTERYCNPSYSSASTLFNLTSLRSQTFTQGDIYAEETQTSTQSSNRSKTKFGSCIEDSLERNQSSVVTSSYEGPSTSTKRVREEEIKLESSPKHMKLQEKYETLPDTSMSVLPDADPVLLENDLSREIKIEPPSAQPLVRIPTPTTEEIDSIEDVPTQAWDDFSDLNVTVNVPEGFMSKPPKKSLTDTKREDSNLDDELPSKLINIEYAALCPPRSVRPIWIPNANDPIEPNRPVANFKKFRKVFSMANRLPRIIGGRDLVTYDRSSSKTFEEWLSQHPETQPEREEVGLFDWDVNSNSRKRKR